MKTHCLASLLIVSTIVVTISRAADPPTEPSPLASEILRNESVLWNAFNHCDLDKIEKSLAADIEFYHDRAGLTVGNAAVVGSLKKGLCGGSKPKLRREVVAGTTKVFPLRTDDQIYGAIVTGEHMFFANPGSKEEQLDSCASYIHLWLKGDSGFRMARILSYNHHLDVPASSAAAIRLTPAALDGFVGSFRGSYSGQVEVVRDGDHLVLKNGKKRFVIYPQSENTFLMKERNVTFEFQTSAGQLTGIIVHEHGKIAEELKFDQ